MKKKIWIPIVIVVLLFILFLPLPSGKYDDGGSRSYTALTYKIVDWHKVTGVSSVYDDTCIYFFPNNFKSIDELWKMEMKNSDPVGYPVLMRAEVVEIYEDLVIAEAIYSSKVGQLSGRVSFGTGNLEDISVSVGDIVEVSYTGEVKETYPMQISAISWRKIDTTYAPLDIAEWMGIDSDTISDSDIYFSGEITEIGSGYIVVNYFHYNEQRRYDIRLNGDVGDWCVGDEVEFTFEDACIDKENYRIEADLVKINQALVYAKPVIYLYPERETEVTVNLTLGGKLTCTYPAYNNGWIVTASPDGTLTDKNGQTYNYLYWEGESGAQYDLSKGFCVKGEDTADFLEKALSDLGLTRREANEFIVYWLPLMEQNPYNIISFQTDAYTESAKLGIDPAPDTLIRVFMVWQATDDFVDLPAQDLAAPERMGFTVIEWGGTQIN